MHIVLVTTSYPDETPGSEAAGSFVADFAAKLGEENQVTVVAAGRRDASSQEANVNVVRFAVPHLPLSTLSPFNPVHWPGIVAALRNGQRALDAVTTEKKPDHVFALWALPSGYWARKTRDCHNIDYCVWALGSDIWGLGRLPVLKSMLRRVLRDAKHLFADGHALAEDVAAIAGRSCEFLPSSRELPVVEPKEPRAAAPYRLAFLGRWHRNKGVDVLLAALEGLDHEDWQRISEVRIRGGGPLHDDVHARTRALVDAGRPVDLGGFIDREAAAELLRWSDYLIVPSRVESVPVIFSDAAQTGTPMVATPVGDLPRLFDEFDVGVLAASASAEDLVEAIRRALQTDASRFRDGLAKAARAFDVGAVARRVAELLSGQTGV